MLRIYYCIVTLIIALMLSDTVKAEQRQVLPKTSAFKAISLFLPAPASTQGPKQELTLKDQYWSSRKRGMKLFSFEASSDYFDTVEINGRVVPNLKDPTGIVEIIARF